MKNARGGKQVCFMDIVMNTAVAPSDCHVWLNSDGDDWNTEREDTSDKSQGNHHLQQGMEWEREASGRIKDSLEKDPLSASPLPLSLF